MSDNFKNVYNGINLEPISADPSNPKEGDLQISDGTARTKGLWRYNGTGWIGFIDASEDLVVDQIKNIELVNGTTTNANDSIQIVPQGSDGVIVLPGTTPGQLTEFTLTSTVTIDLTGAHWDLGGNGDETDYRLSVYAINDAGTLKWGVSATPNLKEILGTDDDTTQTNITSTENVLVNSALTGNSMCLEIGWFKADFDDTGGAAEDLWAIQTGNKDINMGRMPSMWKPYTPSTQGLGTTTLVTAEWLRTGTTLQINMKLATGTNTAAEAQINLPIGYVIDSTLIPEAMLAGAIQVQTDSASEFIVLMTGGDTFLNFSLGTLVPMNGNAIFNNAETITLQVSVPITGWN